MAAELIKMKKNTCVASVRKENQAAWAKKGWKLVEAEQKEKPAPVLKTAKPEK